MELKFKEILVEGHLPHMQPQPFPHDLERLEQELCDYIGAPYCVCVASATTAMLLALCAAEIGVGDTVLCTSFSYFATAEIVALAGAQPMLVDINPNTFSIDPYCLEYVINKCKRNHQPLPKALIAVDLFGLPCNYEALEEICQRHGILLIEDMAQSFGATFQGKRAGNFGRMAVASFFPAKPLTELGEGGAVFCRTPEDMRRLQSLRRSIGTSAPPTGARGSGLNSIQASMVGEKLALFDQELEQRRQVAQWYRDRLEGTVKLQQEGEGFSSAYTQFVISLKNADARSEMIERLQRSHIPCEVFEPSPLRRRELDEEWGRVVLVNAKAVAQKILSLPIHPYLSRRVVNYICDRVLEGVDAPILSAEESIPSGFAL